MAQYGVFPMRYDDSPFFTARSGASTGLLPEWRDEVRAMLVLTLIGRIGNLHLFLRPQSGPITSSTRQYQRQRFLSQRRALQDEQC